MYNQLIAYLSNQRTFIEQDLWDDDSIEVTLMYKIEEIEILVIEEFIEFLLEEKEKNEPKIKLEDDKFMIWKYGDGGVKTKCTDPEMEDKIKHNGS